jgi:hypothetical protein
MTITLAMLVDLSKTKVCGMKSMRSFQDLNSQSITLNAAKSLLNWWVVLILFFPSRDPGGVGSSNTYYYYSTYSTHLPLSFCILRSNYHRNWKRGSLIDVLSSTYALYSCTINLILIVIVTPSIVNPGPIPPLTNARSPCELKVAYCNMQGIIMMSSIKGCQPIFQTHKLLDFQNYLHMKKPDIVIINESWLNEHVHDNEIVSESYYKTFRRDRTADDKLKFGKKGGGGVFFLVKQGLNIESKLVSINCGHVPIQSIEIKFHDGSKICFSTFYRYGYSSMDTFELAQTYFRELSRKYNKILVIGDMNLSTVSDWDNPSSSSSLESSYVDLFNDLGLTCLINSPTHRGGNTLDLLLTNQPGLVKDLSIEPDLICPSDHFSVTFTLRKNVARKNTNRQTIFKYKDADWEALSLELRSHNWHELFHNKSILDSWNIFKSKLDIAMRKCIPMAKIKVRQQPPWFDSEIFEMSKTKSRLRKMFKQTRSTSDEDNLNKYKTLFKQKVIEKKKKFVTADPCESPNNNTVNKKFWSFIKSNTKCGRIPESTHYKGRYRSKTVDQCELFNKFFCDQFSEESSYDISINMPYQCDLTFSSYQIFQFLRKVNPTKAPGPDGISGYVLKHCASALSFPLSLLFNIAFVQGELPMDWRMAHVVPIHKKGRKDDVENYRPISLTSLVMKIFEKCIRTELLEATLPKITPYQHGFLPTRSCTTQMLNYVDFLTCTLNNKSQADVIYFDFSKAFDSVNHDIILQKLKIQYGIDGFLLRFFKSYLKNRKQCVTIDGKFSSHSEVLSGVPQGSILGPLLFVLFINDIVDVVKSNILLYADDMKVFREIKTIDDSYILQSDIDALSRWSIRNKMNFHPDKCKALRCTLKTVNHNSFVYNLAGIALDTTPCEKDLGVMVSPNMKWNAQHRKLLSKAGQKLGLLRRSCSFSKNLSHRKVLYLAIVRSQFEHCSQIWRPVNATQMDKFEALQKRGIKWVFGEDFSYYTKSEYFGKLKRLKILPLSEKFDLNDLVMFHKILYSPSAFLTLPSYLVQNNINLNDTQVRQTRSVSSADNLQFSCSIYPRVDAFVDSFFHRTYKKWNALPFDIRNVVDPNVFKSNIQSHLWTSLEEKYCND